VPIPLKAHIRDYAGDDAVTLASLDVEGWIRCPTETGHWSKHVKVSGTYALIYHSTTTPSSVLRPESGIGGQQVLLEMVSDILFLKLRDKTVVDIEDEDIIEVVQEIGSMF
jgi:hypothetical protein